MEIKIISEKNTILNQFLLEIRDENIQRDSMRFRRNMERIGEIMAYEISKQLQYSEKEVVTSLGIANVIVPNEKPVLATILRAGLPLHQGLLNYFDGCDSSFISAYRKYSKDGTFKIELEYITCPNLDERTLILCDPMLATGSSMVLAYNSLLKNGKPLHTHIVTIIACKDGINYMQKHLFGKNITIWAAAVDEELTVKSYIIPGLGDAGDLAYGMKEHN
ncbi:MAG: uracil phosphoribosyltransferase [Bacteroidetes bacterium GWA2_32_17]|nr:MAG: uracil phosphoribosyltransferase [Bacteroidetes bacterium GWA2_32_17]